jgi:hypothetical protein
MAIQGVSSITSHVHATTTVTGDIPVLRIPDAGIDVSGGYAIHGYTTQPNYLNWPDYWQGDSYRQEGSYAWYYIDTSKYLIRGSNKPDTIDFNGTDATSVQWELATDWQSSHAFVFDAVIYSSISDRKSVV